MQVDMHYYGTLAMALAAGIPKDDAEIIAYASQFVDDSTGTDSEENEDHGPLYAINTAQGHRQVIIDNPFRIQEITIEQRRVWIPFHYLPGGEGTTFSEKLLCIKNSKIAQKMLEHSMEVAHNKPFELHLIGITAHVYMDTFTHYGFSGISSTLNRIKNNTILLNEDQKIDALLPRLNVAHIAEGIARGLGHVGVIELPDIPYLKWQFEFDRPRSNYDDKNVRDNSIDFMEGCKSLYNYFLKFAKKKYSKFDSWRNFASSGLNFRNVKAGKRIKFSKIKEILRNIIEFENDNKEDRIEKWYDSGLIQDCKRYNKDTWEQDKEKFSKLLSSSNGILTDVYRFHQAATYHRYYVLKDLLPSYGIAVY